MSNAVKITTVPSPPAHAGNSHYPSSREPLLADPLAKLPLGAVRPAGWLAHQLALMAHGMTGRLKELSPHLAPENGWLGGDAPGWEEQPYWLRGFHDLAVLTGRQELLEEAARWIEALIGSRQDDGWFGPSILRDMKGRDGRVIHDLWPHMVAVDALIAHHEHTADERVPELLTRFFRFCYDLPTDKYLPRVEYGNYKHYSGVMPFWQDIRAGDFLPQIYWTYTMTGEPWLLDLAARAYERIRPPGDEWLDHHIVNFTQRFAYPALYYKLTHDPRHLALTEYWYAQHLQTWGEQARGIFGADEVIRPGCVDPRQGFETCGMVEFAKNFYLLARITGDTVYADRAEDILLNHFPAAQTPDLKALHYLTASNQPQLDDSRDHEYSNKGRQIIYSPHIYRCCQHNVAMGWPWYAQNLWHATSDNGLAAWLYAAGEVTARVGESGAEVRIAMATDYPFDETVKLRVESAQGAPSFPLYLRIPGWCGDPQLEVDGRAVELAWPPSGSAAESRSFKATASSRDAAARAGGCIRIEKQWKAGDAVTLALPMQIALTEWPRTGSLTVERGPLAYSVRIEEKWKRCGGTDAWPEWEVLPATPWNYGLVVDRAKPQDSIRLRGRRQVADQPWTLDAAPIELEARARRIPGWQLENETAGELRQSPVSSEAAEEDITLIPLGCARLRMACLPRVDRGRAARKWR